MDTYTLSIFSGSLGSFQFKSDEIMSLELLIWQKILSVSSICGCQKKMQLLQLYFQRNKNKKKLSFRPGYVSIFSGSLGSFQFKSDGIIGLELFFWQKILPVSPTCVSQKKWQFGQFYFQRNKNTKNLSFRPVYVSIFSGSYGSFQLKSDGIIGLELFFGKKYFQSLLSVCL